MHPFWGENIDGSGKRRRNRGHKHRKASVRQFFDNERGDEGFFNLGERGLPDIFLLILPCQSLRQTSKERVARHPFEKRSLDALLDRVAGRGAHVSADEKAENRQEEELENVFRG